MGQKRFYTLLTCILQPHYVVHVVDNWRRSKISYEGIHSSQSKKRIYLIDGRLLQTTPGVVFHNTEEMTEQELSSQDDNHNIFSVGKKDVSKLGTFYAKNSPLKPMFDQVIITLFYCAPKIDAAISCDSAPDCLVR